MTRSRTARGRTALGRTALGRTALGRTALGLVRLMVAVGLSACGGSMGMDRGPLATHPADQPIEYDDAQVEAELARRPQLPARPRVAVHFRAPANDAAVGAWRWTFEERQAVVDAADAVEGMDAFPITDSFIERDDLPGLRLAAARHGAEALLIVTGRPRQDTHDNGWLAMYPLLLPILFAPAQELDTFFRAEATLYDVRNGFLYVTAEAEGQEEQQRAHVWIDREGGVANAKRDAMRHLATELTERLNHLTGARAGGVQGATDENASREDATTENASAHAGAADDASATEDNADAAPGNAGAEDAGAAADSAGDGSVGAENAGGGTEGDALPQGG